MTNITTPNTNLLSYKSTKKQFYNTSSAAIKLKRERLLTNASVQSMHTMNNFLNERKLGISQYQSANTYQNSVPTISFAKSERFKFLYKKLENESIYDINSLSNKRTTTQGYGKKWNFLKLLKNTPAPTDYNLPSFGINTNKGKTMSLKIPIKYDNINPGVGKYNIVNNQNNSKINISLKSRLGFFYDEDVKKKKFCVSPQTYNLCFNQTKNLRFSKITFGIGKKYERINSNRNYPGPGSYNIPSIFDKTRKSKLPLN